MSCSTVIMHTVLFRSHKLLNSVFITASTKLRLKPVEFAVGLNQILTEVIISFGLWLIS